MITKGISLVSHLEPSTCWCPLPYISDRQALVAILVGAGGHIHRLDTPSSRVEVRGGEGMEGGGRVWEGVGVAGGGRRWEGPSQPSFHSCWCEHSRLSRARWRSLACSCHCSNSQTLNSQLKSEPIIWKHMVVNVAGTMVAMVDDKGYIWMGSSNFKVGPATLQVVLAGRGPGSCLLARQLSSSPHPHLLSHSDLPL